MKENERHESSGKKWSRIWLWLGVIVLIIILLCWLFGIGTVEDISGVSNG